MIKTKVKLDALNSNDTYSLLLFALFKLKESPEYSTLSELSYILDRDSLLRFLKYFGGTTITVPTVRELNLVAKCLLIYQQVNIEHKDFDSVVSGLNISSEYNLTEIKKMYMTICNVTENYTFSGGYLGH